MKDSKFLKKSQEFPKKFRRVRRAKINFVAMLFNRWRQYAAKSALAKQHYKENMMKKVSKIFTIWKRFTIDNRTKKVSKFLH